MGRSRCYDEDTVLSGAMHAFRRKGYQAVSIRDLEQATGLKAGSIYNSFGDKAGLFDAAFAHYNRAVLHGRIDRYATVGAGLNGLRDLFLSLLHEPNGEAFGCLITNTAVELGGGAHPHHGVEEGLRTLQRTFTDRLNAARRDGVLGDGVLGDGVVGAGVLGAGVEPAQAAVKLLALYQGVLVLVRAGYDRAALEQLVNNEFKDLERSHDA